jgi:hypothetical protein
MKSNQTVLARLARLLAELWNLLWVVRVPGTASALLVYLFLAEDQCRDSLRYMLEYVDAAPRTDAIIRLSLLLSASALGSLAFWFWARQCLRAAPEDAAREDAIGIRLPRVIALAPLVALVVTAGRLKFDDPAMQGKRWLFAGAFLALAIAIYVALRVRQRAQKFAWLRTDMAYRWMAWSGFGMALLVFVFSLFVREYAVLFGPAGVVWLGAAFWVTVLSPLAIHGLKHGVPWLLLLAALGSLLGLGNCTDNHEIRHTREESAGLAETAPVTRTPVAEGFRAWLKGRPADSPVIFVAAEGGGIYAAYHAAYLLSRLQVESEGEFGRQLFMISGVSGGSVGSGLFVSLLASEKAGRQVDYVAATKKVLEADLLSPLLLAAAGPDALQRFLPVPVPIFDRARALEDTLAQRWRAVAQGWPGRGHAADWGPAGSIWDLWLTDDGRNLRADLPALFVNMTIVESGMNASIAPYGIPATAGGNVPVMQHLWAGAHGLRIPIPAALGLSARFPYVTPPGGLNDIYLRPVDLPVPPNGMRLRDWRFADAGYYDNTGLETVLAVLQSLADEPLDPSAPRRGSLLPLDRVRVLIIRARNEAERPNNEGLADLLTPVRTLLRVREHRGDLALINLRARLPDEQYTESTLATQSLSRRNAVQAPGGPPRGKPDIPLGWMLSQNSARRIREHVDRRLPDLRGLLLQTERANAKNTPAVQLKRG